tara:strand:- start:239 stop:340 length:102 start_codon:yes stop_codon:yes gene_type:complete
MRWGGWGCGARFRVEEEWGSEERRGDGRICGKI